MFGFVDLEFLEEIFDSCEFCFSNAWFLLISVPFIGKECDV